MMYEKKQSFYRETDKRTTLNLWLSLTYNNMLLRHHTVTLNTLDMTRKNTVEILVFFRSRESSLRDPASIRLRIARAYIAILGGRFSIVCALCSAA